MLLKRNQGSFRDPSGQVYELDRQIWRTVLPAYKAEWEWLLENKLLNLAKDKGLLDFEILQAQVALEKIAESGQEKLQAHFAQSLAILTCQRLPFISYPWEWCFSQIKEAALLTLDLQLLALEHQGILKDATAFNVQFYEGQAVFIDLLSFERWQEGQPWQAYGQFCSHFLAPLALIHYLDAKCSQLARLWIDGIPLEIASKLLPWTTYLKPSLLLHLHLHAKMRQTHADARESSAKVQQMNLPLQKMQDIARELKSAINSIKAPSSITEWGDYYNDTNYTAEARLAKEKAVQKLASNIAEKIIHKESSLAVDLGANTGEFSNFLAPHFNLVLACDVDHTAVERHWTQRPLKNVLPLILDLANPSPSLGWACAERESFAKRCQANLVLALAVCHHLRFTFGIPFAEIASFFKSLLKDNDHSGIIVEFVPKTDSQVERLLASRDDVFTDYTEDNFVSAFKEQDLTLVERLELPESSRIIFLFEKKLQ